MKRFALTFLLFNGLLLALMLPRYPGIPWVAAEALMVYAVFSLLPPSLFTRVLAGVVGTLYAVLALFTLSDLMLSNLGTGLSLLILTLIYDMAGTGHDTVAVMPAITQDWPEGQAFGYNRIYESTTMDYQGPPFNWVTMPDQYTWSWFQQSVREQAAGPMFAEVASVKGVEQQ